MKQKTVPWGEATLAELKMFASGVLGMSLGPNIGEETLRAKIRQAFHGDSLTIMVLDGEDEPVVADAPAAPSEAPAQGKALRGSSSVNDPKVKITITEAEGAGGKRPVPVQVNGVQMLLPRGRPIDIPYRYYDDLCKAIKTVYEQDETTQEVIATDVPSYPFSVNKMPPQAEIDAFLAADAKA